MAYWLLKTEPDVYSIDDLETEGVAHWEGVRAYPARNNLVAMQVGDRAFFYHSNCPVPAIVGIVEVVRTAYVDHFAFDPESKYYDKRSNPAKPRWFMPDVRFVEKLAKPVPLAAIKRTEALQEMDLVRWGRLSVQRVSEQEWETVLTMGS